MTSAPAIAFELRPARALRWAAAAVLALGLLAIALCGLPLALRAALGAATLLGGAVSLHRYARPAYRYASVQSEEWTLTDASGRRTAARLRRHAAFGRIVQLDFVVDARRVGHLLLPGNSDADTRRRLRLVLAAGAGTDPVRH